MTEQEITQEFVDFTPALAASALGRINIQRKLRQYVVQAYTNDMRNNRWTHDSNAICFNQYGELVNGQHRLTAVVRSGCTIRFTVMRNVTTADMLHMDSGAPRRTSDQLHILGVANSVHIAAAANMLLCYDCIPAQVWSTNTTTAVTKAAIIDYVSDHEQLLQGALSDIWPLAKLRFNRTAMSVLALLVGRDSNNGDMWPEFIEALKSGVGLSQHDPRLALRNYYVRPELRSWGNSQSHLLVSIRAWNKYVQDVEVRVFKTPRREELPMPKVL